MRISSAGQKCPSEETTIALIKSQTKLRFGVTDAGKMLLRGTVYIALATLIVPAFGALAILLAVMLMALAVGFVLRPRILVGGNVPDRTVAGQTVLLTYTLTNTGRLPAYNLHLQFQSLPAAIKVAGDVPRVSRLGSGETAQVTVAVRPERRGCYPIRQPTCQSSFPFSLFHFGTVRAGQETWTVVPPLFRLQVPLRCASRHVTTSGLRPGVRTGASPEYIGSRPFLAGDSPRRIDVRAWARLAVPATKEYDDDFDSYAALILDTRVPTGAGSKAGESSELDAAVSLCASVAYSIHRDCLVDLLLAGPDLHSFTAEPKLARIERIHELLATVEPAPEYGTERVAPLLEERFQEISEAIFILLRWDETYRQMLELADRAGCRSTVVVVGEPDAGKGSPPWRPEDDSASPYRDILFLPAAEILAGRIEHL